MAGPENAEEPENISELMEALWGRRAHGTDGFFSGATIDRSGASGNIRNGAHAPAQTAAAVETNGARPETRVVSGTGKAYVDAALADQAVSSRSWLDAALAANVERVEVRLAAVVQARAASDESLSARLYAFEQQTRDDLGHVRESIRALEVRPAPEMNLEALRSQVRAAVAEELAGARDEAVAAAAAEARVVAAEAGVLDTLARSATRHDEAVARLDAFELDASRRLSALERHVGPELKRLAEAVQGLQAQLATSAAVEDSQKQYVTTAHLEHLRIDVEGQVAEKLVQLRAGLVVEDDLAALLGELRAQLADQLATLRSEAFEVAEARMALVNTDAQEQLGALAEEMAEATSSARSADTALARLRTMEQQVNEELIRLSESVEGNRAELGQRVADLEIGICAWADEWRVEVEERVAGAFCEIGPAPADFPRRLGGKRKIRRTEVARLVDSVEAWRAQSVGEDDFVALRSELETDLAHRVASAQAELERRFAVLDAVVTDAEAESDQAIAALRRDLRGVQVEVRELTTVISELLEEPGATEQPLSRSKETPAPGEKGRPLGPEPAPVVRRRRRTQTR